MEIHAKQPNPEGPPGNSCSAAVRVTLFGTSSCSSERNSAAASDVLSSCALIEFNCFNILVDCPLLLRRLLESPPIWYPHPDLHGAALRRLPCEARISAHQLLEILGPSPQLHAILVTNPHGLLGVPLLLQELQQLSPGVPLPPVLCTTPVSFLGRNGVSFLRSEAGGSILSPALDTPAAALVSQPVVAVHELKHPPVDAKGPSSDLQDLDDRLLLCTYGQTTTLQFSQVAGDAASPLLQQITIQAYSSGFCLGGANWLLQSPTVYLHLRIILTAVRGQKLELLPFLLQQLPRSLSGSCSCIYTVGFNAPQLLRFADQAVEWVKAPPQTPDGGGKKGPGDALLACVSPFGFEDFQQAKRLCAVELLDELPDLRHPCVVLATTAALRTGPAALLLQQWRSRPDRLLIVADPLYTLPGDIRRPPSQVQQLKVREALGLEIRRLLVDSRNRQTDTSKSLGVSASSAKGEDTVKSTEPALLSLSRRVASTALGSFLWPFFFDPYFLGPLLQEKQQETADSLTRVHLAAIPLDLRLSFDDLLLLLQQQPCPPQVAVPPRFAECITSACSSSGAINLAVQSTACMPVSVRLMEPSAVMQLETRVSRRDALRLATQCTLLGLRTEGPVPIFHEPPQSTLFASSSEDRISIASIPSGSVLYCEGHQATLLPRAPCSKTPPDESTCANPSAVESRCIGTCRSLLFGELDFEKVKILLHQKGFRDIEVIGPADPATEKRHACVLRESESLSSESTTLKIGCSQSAIQYFPCCGVAEVYAPDKSIRKVLRNVLQQVLLRETLHDTSCPSYSPECVVKLPSMQLS